MKWNKYNFRENQYLFFILGGLLNAALSYSTYLILKSVLSYGVAYLIAYILGIVLAYYLNGHLVFKATLSWKRFITYPSIYLIQYLFSSFLLNILIVNLGIDTNVAPLIVMFLMIPFSFVMNKSIFNKK